MFRPCGRAGKLMTGQRDNYSLEEGIFVSASNLKFVIFRDLKDCYRWRLSSASGQTVEHSERGYDHKGECEHDVFRLKDDRYPKAKVLDAAIG
jgi:uncharacterized protein YegP (UPF0339 family)